jgi:hypothetical protein
VLQLSNADKFVAEPSIGCPQVAKSDFIVWAHLFLSSLSSLPGEQCRFNP